MCPCNFNGWNVCIRFEQRSVIVAVCSLPEDIFGNGPRYRLPNLKADFQFRVHVFIYWCPEEVVLHCVVHLFILGVRLGLDSGSAQPCSVTMTNF